MSKKIRRFYGHLPTSLKKHSCYPILATHLAAKDDSRGGVVASYVNSAERLLSEQSVLLLGEANSQTRKELL